MMADPNCPKCDGPMEVGSVSDHFTGGMLKAQWVDGAKVGFLKSARQITIVSHRCKRCGFLEQYAPNPQ
jgi:hypothetical protein